MCVTSVCVAGGRDGAREGGGEGGRLAVSVEW